MERIISVIKDGTKTTRLGVDADACLRMIRLISQAPRCEAFTEAVEKKIMARAPKKIAA